MWESLAAAEAARAAGDHQTARIHYQQARTWAARTVSDRSWYALALRDNLRKRSELGGIVSYPRGTTWPHNEHPLHTAILRYPLLNEIATALWGLAVCSYELGEYATAGQWIRRIIEDVPLHQIPSVKTDPATGEILIDGYWNALVAWEQNPDRNLRDTKMQKLYLDLLKEKNLTSALPDTVKPTEHSKR